MAALAGLSTWASPVGAQTPPDPGAEPSDTAPADSTPTLPAPATLPAAPTPPVPAPVPSPAAKAAPAGVTGVESIEWESLLDMDVVTASRQRESLKDTPVPVTLITAEMIRLSGARSLSDVLTTFVPGFTQVEDHNEMNVAVRGIYASSQQKFLVLLNGHRLNSRAYSMANPDFSMGLDKVEQIEVLRGPGSSIYGNVSLVGVVNIVTKDGASLNGYQVTAGAGNYGQVKTSVLYGTEFDVGHDLLLWADTYRAAGEEVFIPASQDYSRTPQDSTAIVDGAFDPYSYDVGFQYRHDKLSVLASRRRGKLTEPFSGGGVTGESYNYDDYRTAAGIGPGLASTSSHLEVGYKAVESSRFDASAKVYFDQNDLDGFLVTNPSVQGQALVEWNEWDVGGILETDTRYDLGGAGHGSVLAGAEVDRMELVDSIFLVGSAGNWTGVGDSPDNQLLDKGQETIYSVFTQATHYLTDQGLTLNAGARYDIKDRHLGDSVSAFSPRLAAVYSPTRNVILKLSYGESFVDAPYWYRYNSLASYGGSENLQPERLRALQFSPTVSFLGGRLTNTLNVYYQDAFDLIFRNNTAMGTVDDPFYQNAGRLKSFGAEEEVAFVGRDFRVRGNFAYQRALEAVGYPVRDERVYNVPSLSANLVVDVRPLYSLTDNLWLNVTGQYIGKQLSPVAITFRDAMGNVIITFDEPNREVDAAFLLNAGIHVTDLPAKGIFLDATVHNLLDERRYQGGSVLHPYPRAGRWFLVSLGIRGGL